MPYLNQKRYGTIIDIPISLPQTDLYAGNSISVATVPLAEGQMMRIRWLQVQMLGYTSPPPPTVPLNIDAFGFVYAAVYDAGNLDVDRPTGTPLVLLNVTGAGTKGLNVHNTFDIYSPSVYQVALMNNTNAIGGVNVSLTLTGSIRLYLNGLL
jgi:hypothetical protein